MIKQKEKDTHSVFLFSVLGVLGVVIVGLIIGIVVAGLQRNQLPKELDCSLQEGDYSKQECLSQVIEQDEDIDEATVVKMYDKVLDKALEDENYYLYADTLNDEVSRLVVEDKCDEAMSTLGKATIAGLSVADLAYYYSFARDNAEMCKNDTKANEYDSKYQELIDSGQVVVDENGEIIEVIDLDNE